MAITVIIPDDIEESLKIPAEEQEQEIDKELALSFYQRGALSLGKARQLARLTKWQFQEELAKRKIVRHYSKKELDEDVAYARSK